MDGGALVSYNPQGHKSWTQLCDYTEGLQVGLPINRTVYEDRKERQGARVEAMIRYVQSDDTCRLVTLLDYFGEHLSHPCGTCDVCRRNAPDPEDAVTRDNAVRDAVLTFLTRQAGPVPVGVLTSALADRWSRDDITRTLRHLTDTGKILLHDFQLQLNE